MPGQPPEPVARVAGFLADARAAARRAGLGAGAPPAGAAAAARGEPDQIVKSLVFVCDGAPVLALVPGSRRADPKKVAAAVGARSARIASADVVREATGFDVGGVAPFPTPGVSRVVAERTLLSWNVVWVGAGSDRHMAGLAPAELVRLAHASTADLCLDG